MLGSTFAFLSVAAGAFGAHALKDRLTSDHLETFQTAARYQMSHALALFVVAYAAYRFGGALVTAAGWLFVAGIALFAGSLYALALSGVSILGAITPFGGLCFLAGWVCLALAAWRA